MSQRPRNDWPRLSGRPETPTHAENREPQTVIRRFFELLERFDRPHGGPGTPTKAAPLPRKEGK